MRGFGITGVDFSLEVQMDKLAHKVGMDPMEFRILNAYRDGDMKAHRREAHNCALIECVQVAAEKAGLADPRRVPAHELAHRRRRRARRHPGHGHRRERPHRRGPAGDRTRRRVRRTMPIAPPPRVPQPAAAQPPRLRNRRPAMPQPPRRAAATACRAPRSRPKPAATPQHGATRFSSVFGTRRR